MNNSRIHEFTLTIQGVSDLTDEQIDGLYEAGCDDATILITGMTVYQDFDREAENLETAILTAIRDTESADPAIQVARVEPADLVTAAEIARRTGRSKESIRLLINGDRGDGDFPKPLAGVTTKTKIWSWLEVLRWFHHKNKMDDPQALEQAEVISGINQALEIRNRSESLGRIRQYVDKLSEMSAQAT